MLVLVFYLCPVQRITPQGSQRTPATFIAATTPELTVGIFKFSVLNLKKTLNFLNNPVTLARYKHAP